MSQRVIYPHAGGLAVLIPTDEFLATYTIQDVAAKDVPIGVPYRIIDEVDIPTDSAFRNAWEADFSTPDGYGIGHEAWVASKESAQ